MWKSCSIFIIEPGRGVEWTEIGNRQADDIDRIDKVVLDSRFPFPCDQPDSLQFFAEKKKKRKEK